LYEKAVEVCKKAIELMPNILQAYHNLGIALLRLNRLNEAEQAFLKVVELRPDFAPAYYHLSVIYESMSDNAKAKAYREKAIQLGFPVDQ
jgi:tetratricopeptide (TPR) repeat protein